MKKVISSVALLFAVAACHHASPPAASPASTVEASRSGNATGASSAEAAVRGFLAAVKNQDLQALSSYWGDKEGLARDRYALAELNRRELIMMCYLKHDTAQILSEAPSPDGGRTVAVQLTLGKLSASTNFQTVVGPDGRWYVLTVPEIASLEPFCAKR
jgi:hypothetical protein